MLASVIVLPACAEEVSPKPLGEKASSSLEAIKRVDKYSHSTGGIGILIAYGTGNGKGITPQYVGDEFVKEIKRRGWHAKYFYYIADWEGMSVEYHIRHSALGPWSADEAAGNISKAVARAKAAQQVHNQ